MAFYYCINDVLDGLEDIADSEKRFLSLVPVATEPPECGGHQDDAFTLASSPKILDLTQAESAYQLAQLVEEVPLYGINLELVLDQALFERHKNARIENALNQAFSGQPLPNTLRGTTRDDGDMSGGLRHPMLGHLEKVDLCKIYIKFLKVLDRGKVHFGFERTVLGKHIERFLDRYDGYIAEDGGKIKAGILLAFGARLDHDPGKSVDNHAESGRKLAAKMRIEEPHELVWAWLEADEYQMRRCRDIDRVLKLEGLPRTPNWVRTDIFACAGKESAKQVFAQTLLRRDPSLALLQKAPGLEQAIRENAGGGMDAALEGLLAQTRNQRTASYGEEALKFADRAWQRNAEAKKAGLF